MQDLHTLPAKQTLQIKILDVQRAADFAGAIVMDSRPARAKTAVGDVELMPVTPWPALRDIHTFVSHVATAQVALDHGGNRTVRNKCRQDLDG